MTEEQNQITVLNNVLNITRDQLSRSMNLNAELEALLTMEQSRVQELEKKIEELTAADSKKSDK
jgi:predicted  nucleic acid-binding Zn-ribbon protein